jgi:DNA-binding transcriptional MerR regulator
VGDARDTSKAPDAFRTISEVAEDLDLPQHVLRFWETRFTHIRPVKRGGGRRFYRPEDVDLLRGIRHLLYSDGYTIKGVQKILKEHGIRHVQDLGVEHDVAVMRSARETGTQDGVTFGGLLGLLPRRRPRPAADDAIPAMDELPLPFPDPEADREAGRDVPPLDIPLRQRSAAQGARPSQDGRGREPRTDPLDAPPRGRAPEAGSPVRREARRDDRREGGREERLPTPPAAPPRQRPTRGPAARIAPEPNPPAAHGTFDDPLLPFFDEAPLAPAALSEPLDARIRRLKGDIAAEDRRARIRPEEGPARARRPAPEASREALPDAAFETRHDFPRSEARPHDDAPPRRPPAARRPAPEHGVPLHGRRSWDDLEADDVEADDLSADGLEADELAQHAAEDRDAADDLSGGAAGHPPRRADRRMRPEVHRDDWDDDGFAPPGAAGGPHFPEADADDPFAPPRRPERRPEHGPHAPYADGPARRAEPHRPDGARRDAVHPHARDEPRIEPRAEPWARPHDRDDLRDRRGPAVPPPRLAAEEMQNEGPEHWAARPLAAPARRSVPRFGPFAGPPEEIAPAAPEPLSHARSDDAGPGPSGRAFDAETPAAAWPRRAGAWHGYDPVEAASPRRPAPPEPLRHGPPEQYLPPHLRSEPRITGQPPGAAPVLSRADVHRLQAALYELTECRRLMGDAMGRDKGAGGPDHPGRDDAAPL